MLANILAALIFGCVDWKLYQHSALLVQAFVPGRWEGGARAQSSRIFDPKSQLLAHVTFVSGSADSKYGMTSPEPNPSWSQVSKQLAKRLPHFSQSTQQNEEEEDTPCITTSTISIDDLKLDQFVSPTDIVVVLGVTETDDYEKLLTALEKNQQRATSSSIRAVLCDPTCCEAILQARFAGSYCAHPTSRFQKLRQSVTSRVAPWSAIASHQRLLEKTDILLNRKSSEDYIFAILFAVHSLVTPIDVVKSDINPSWEKGVGQNIKEFATMCDKCLPQIQAALTDPTSKHAIDQLNALDLRDQVGSYRVIVSNETPQLEDFTLCILQQNNCFNCDAPILTQPKVPVLTEWPSRKPLTAQTAQQILIGHLDHPAAHPKHSKRQPWSWKIVVGANPAYDAFPMQHQIFYPTGMDKRKEGDVKAAFGKGLWYDPVFGVETLQGDLIWCKRHYRCIPRKHWSGTDIGTWKLTTLDNGMVSEEHWTTVDAADDLSWAVLHYSGAARNAGQSYVGALLCTPDGKWPLKARKPDSPAYQRIQRAFANCDLELWELFGGSTTHSYLWEDHLTEWAADHPPPLNPIGDQSITSWRKREREKLEQQK